VDAIGLSGSGAPEEKNDDNQTTFSRVDLGSFNAHYSAAAASLSAKSIATPSEDKGGREGQATGSWSMQQVVVAVQESVPEDALSSSALGEDTYQALRQQQQAAGPDPHLQVSSRQQRVVPQDTPGPGLEPGEGRGASATGSAGSAKGEC
jgi:hypothetical protein